MSPTNSTLLSIALADFVPESCQPPAWRAGARGVEGVGPGADELPPGHHLVYFPLQKTASALCRDGTDPLHSPDGPFVRRMWAGGSVEFRDDDFRLDSQPVVCRECIDDVAVKGPEGQEKIFVDVLREYMRKEDFESTRLRGLPMTRGIRERRGLVFMRGLSKEQARENLVAASKGRGRIVKGMSYTISYFLLFVSSALLVSEFCDHG